MVGRSRTQRTVRLLIVVTVVLAAPPLTRTVGAGHLGCGSVITADTTLTHNITGCTGTALSIGANGVTLDLAGFVVGGVDAREQTRGISTMGHSGVVVRNGIVKGFDIGVQVIDGRDNKIESLAAKSNFTNIYLTDTANTRVLRSKMVNGIGHGLNVAGGGNNLVFGNRIYNNGTGILNDSGTGNRIQGNTITYNRGTGIISMPSLTILDNNVSHNGGEAIYQYRNAQTALDAMTITANLICDNGRSGIYLHYGGHTVSDNDVGAGTADCLPNGRVVGSDLHDQAASELPWSSGTACPSTWRNNYTQGDTFNHPCVTR